MERMFHKTLSYLFSHPWSFSSRNNALIVFIAVVSVFMNYRSTFYGFRNSLLRQWINWQPSLSQSSPKKRNEGLSRALRHKGRTSLSLWHFGPLSFYLWGHDGLQGSAPELSFPVIDKGAQSPYICLLSGNAKSPPCHLLSAHRSAFRGMHQKSPTSEPTSPRETAAFCNPLFTHIQVLVPVEG